MFLRKLYRFLKPFLGLLKKNNIYCMKKNWSFSTYSIATTGLKEDSTSYLMRISVFWREQDCFEKGGNVDVMKFTYNFVLKNSSNCASFYLNFSKTNEYILLKLGKWHVQVLIYVTVTKVCWNWERARDIGKSQVKEWIFF